MNPLNQCGKPARPAESLANVPYRARRWLCIRRQPDGTLTCERYGGLQGYGLTKRPSRQQLKWVTDPQIRKDLLPMKRLSPTFASAGLLAIVTLAGCSDDPRIPDGDRFSESVVGMPGVVMIDNMEDGTQYLLSDDGRVGLWYIYNDASLGSTQLPAVGFPMYRVLRDDGSPEPSAAVPPRPCGGTAETPFFAGESTDECAFVARTWGAGQRGWGAGVGLDLNGEGGTKNPFDASAYGGIGFFAMGDIRDGALRVNVQDARTTPESAEAADRRGIPRCESFRADGTETGRCNDHFGQVVTISPTWQWYEIPFSCMASGNWGFPMVTGDSDELLSEAVVGIQFQITGADPADTGMPSLPVRDFDFSIDNISFLEKSHIAPEDECP